MARTYQGGCLCGAVRLRAVGSALKPHPRSCTMCRRHSGAFTVSWVEFPRDAVTWAGAPLATWRSAAGPSRAFGPVCGSTLGAIDDAPVVALVLGAFDQPARKKLAPTDHSFAGKRPRWWHVAIGEPEAPGRGSLGAPPAPT